MRKKLTEAFLSPFVVFFILLVGLYLGGRAYYTPLHAFAETFDLHLPNRIKILEHKQERGFTGDGDIFFLIKPKNPLVTKRTDLDLEHFTTGYLNEKEKEIVTNVGESLNTRFTTPVDTPVLKRAILKSYDRVVIIYDKSQQIYAIYQLSI